MNKLHRTAFVFFLLVSLVSISCKKTKEARIYSNNNIQLSPSQAVPPNATSASGTLSVSYNDISKTLSYTVTYSNLSGPITALHIHGLAAPGFNAPVIQSFVASGNTQPFSGTASSDGKSGTYSNSLFVDGLVVREEDLLAGQYYLDIHTAAYPATGAAQLRGQITFNQ